MATSRTGRSRNLAPNGTPLSDQEKILFNQVLESLSATSMSRAALFRGLMGDARRDLDAECGYIKAPVAQQYQDRFDRNTLAAKVVQAWVRETWKVQPEVYEDEDPDIETPWEKEWKELGQKLRGKEDLGESWSSTENTGHPIWDYLKKLDELSGIGRYGVMLFGLSDTKLDSDLAKPAPKKVKGTELLFLRVFPETLAEISTFDTDPFSPRFGKPLSYNLTFNDLKDGGAAIGYTNTKMNVHWSRVLHVADTFLQASSSVVFANSRMQVPLDDIDDYRKVKGASSEGYYKSAFTGLSFETHPDLGTDAKINVQQLREQMENYQNSLQRVLAAVGGTWKTLAPNIIDPSPHLERILESVAIFLDMPKRKLMGTEKGELGSSQDEKDWNKKVAGRQNNYATPNLLIPCVDRLIGYGVQPEPASGKYILHWPDLNENDPNDIAKNALTYTQALAAYVSSDVSSFMPPTEYFVNVWKMTNSEAEELGKAAEKAMEEQEKEMEEMLAQTPPQPGKPIPGKPKPVPTGTMTR